MASPKALAAIALTLIVAAPIILGYAMVADTEETTEWVTESTINSSDLLLNHQTPYTMDMTGAVNNSTILQKQVFPGQGATEWHTVAPAYNSVSSKPTSLPTYTSTSATYSLPSMSTNQYNISYSGNNSIGGPNSGADILVTDYPASNLSLTTSAQPIHFMIELTTDSRTYSVVGPVSTIFARDGASTYAVQVTDSFNNTTVYGREFNLNIIGPSSGMPFGNVGSFRSGYSNVGIVIDTTNISNAAIDRITAGAGQNSAA